MNSLRLLCLFVPSRYFILSAPELVGWRGPGHGALCMQIFPLITNLYSHRSDNWVRSGQRNNTPSSESWHDVLERTLGEA